MPGKMMKKREGMLFCSVLPLALLLMLLLVPCCASSAEEVNSPDSHSQDPNDHDDGGDNNSRPSNANSLDVDHDRSEFIGQLFLKYGDGEGRLSFRGFSALMGSIGLGDAGGVSGTAHDHREHHGADDSSGSGTGSGDLDDGTVPTRHHQHVEWDHRHRPSSPQETQTRGGQLTSHELTSSSPSTADRFLPSSAGGVTMPTGDGHQGASEVDGLKPKDPHLVQCLTPSTLLSIFEIPSSATSLTEGQFLQMCPVLLQQLDSHVCMQFDVDFESTYHGEGEDDGHEDHHDDHDGATTDHDHHHDEDSTHGHQDRNASAIEVDDLTAAIWGYGVAAVTLISLVSIACILVVPCMQHYPHVYHRLISFLVAMAVGTLTGDAMMHLIPHSLGIHVHDDEKSPLGAEEEDGHAHESSQSEKERAVDAVWKGFFVLIGIFVFFIIEQIMGFCQQARKKRKARRKAKESAEQKSSRPGSPGMRGSGRRDESGQQLPEMPGEYTKMTGTDLIGEKLCHHCVAASDKHGGPNKDLIRNSMMFVEDLEMINQASTSHHHHHHNQYHPHHDHPHHDDSPELGTGHHHGHSHEPMDSGGGIATLAWIVVMGDGLHNFCDGLIVGAAFADSIAGGLSTSIAVMCHEVPHELGDFAVLLKGGMTIKQALSVQAMSSVLAFMGLVIGIAAGNVEALSMWIFALAGGMFVYISLVDLFPELIETLNSREGQKMQFLILQGLGTMLGVSIMLFIGLHEDWLRKQLDG